jgi:RNA polymerase sigma factor (sigma-70 family)
VHTGQLAPKPLNQAEEGLADDQLLRRFAAQQDEAAFRALVERHGPMVLEVCRRVLRNAHDAEDAFQATFLVLARKAAAISRPALLANWLYGVAYRVSAKARTSLQRRRVHERQAASMTPAEPPLDAAWKEVRLVLDEEINRLPDKYRAPLVMCYLEGRTNQQAAQLLGWPAGTMSGRLREARDRLRQRLLRRGLALSVGIIALLLLLVRRSICVVSETLLESTVRTASLFARGEAVAAPAAALAQTELVRRRAPRWALLAGALLLLAAVAAGTSCALGAFSSKSLRPAEQGNASGHDGGDCLRKALGP